MKRNVMRSVVGVASAVCAVTALAACGSGPSGGGTASPSPSVGGLSAGDAAAIVGAATVLQQVPMPEGNKVATFLSDLAVTVKTPDDPKVQLGYPGNQLVTYMVSKEGAKSPTCATVRSTDGKPTQDTWSAYYSPDPGGDSKLGMLVLAPKIVSCEDAKKVADEVGTDEKRRNEVNTASIRLLSESFNQLPYSKLDTASLQLLDSLRAGAASASANPSP